MEPEGDPGVMSRSVKQERVASPAPRCLSMKSDRSMDPPIHFKEQVGPPDLRFKQERVESPAPSCLSMKSDWSMEPPENFKRKTWTLDISVKQERVASPAPSCLYKKSGRSTEPTENFKRETWTPDPSASLLTEDQFRCSVCSEVLRDPVSIPCGHSYCRQCISTYWAQPGPARDYVCPQCSKRSRVRPVLYTNTALVRVLQGLQQAGFSPALPALGCAGPGDVACDICSGQKLRAVKSCLTCTVSYCESHVRQHYTVPALQRHTLAEVTGDGGHKEQHGNAGKTEEGAMKTEEDEEGQSVCKKMKVEVEEKSDEGFSDLKKTNCELRKEIFELKNISKLNSDLEQEISQLKHDVGELSKENAVLKQDAAFEKQLMDIRTADLNKTIATLSSDLHQHIKPVLKKMTMDYVDVTLDPDTAHPYLILSEDGKQVRHGDIKKDLCDNPERFDAVPCVLGKEGFSAGRFYYEMQVKGKTRWILGVVKESINRKGNITLSPEDGNWTVWLKNGKYTANANPSIPLSLKENPQKVGVFVDYKEGQVSFYNVQAKSHIYSFTGYTFTEKLYPFFCPGLNDGAKNSEPLVITPVDVTDLTGLYQTLKYG